LRLIFRAAACMLLVLGSAWTGVRPANAGAAQELLPEQSAAKARQVLQQVIAALGGQAYLNARDTDCQGRVAQFGSSGDLAGLTPFRDEWLLPDKNRTEYIAKGEHTILGFLLDIEDLSITHGGSLITVFNGQEGWMLDKGGVSSQPADAVKSFNEQVKSGMNNMLRTRMNEPDVVLQYGGPDIIDLKEAEWIEFTDREHRDLRLAVEKSTHLPLRWVVATRDPDTRDRTEVATSYTQFVSEDGIKTPLSIVRSRNGRKVSQTFLTGCKYNSGLDPQLFTRAALEQRASEVAKKGYKDSKSTK
jgi:hypothetical protein